MPTKITAYRCEWCKKVSTLSGIKLHEGYCRANPEKNCCENCKHGVMELLERDGGWRELSPYCEIHKQFIFTEPKSERPYFKECDVDYRGPHCEEVPIPFSCHHFESKGTHGFTITTTLEKGA